MKTGFMSAKDWFKEKEQEEEDGFSRKDVKKKKLHNLSRLSGRGH